MPSSSWFCSIGGGDRARDADAVAAHLDRPLLAVGVEEGRAHRRAVLGAEVEDLPDLDAAMLRERPVVAARAAVAGARLPQVGEARASGKSRSWSTPTRCVVGAVGAGHRRRACRAATRRRGCGRASPTGPAKPTGAPVTRATVASSASATASPPSAAWSFVSDELVVAAHQRRDGLAVRRSVERAS